MSGTGIEHAIGILRTPYAMSGSCIGIGDAIDAGWDIISVLTQWDIISVLTRHVVSRGCYALPGAGRAYSAMLLRACCAMSGTDIAYGATRGGGARRYVLRVSGTLLRCEIKCQNRPVQYRLYQESGLFALIPQCEMLPVSACCAAPVLACAILIGANVLCNVWYQHHVWCANVLCDVRY
eukprot:386525-Rhodomonas_salina.1